MAVYTEIQRPQPYKGLIKQVRELIGGPQRILKRFTNYIGSSLNNTIDVGTTRYEFWDRARKGKVEGLELSGLLLKPLENKIATWVVGHMPQVQYKSKSTQDYMTKWVAENQSKILSAYRQSLGLGDMYLVVNPDLTLTVIQPNAVRPLVADDDYGHIIGWQIDLTYPHPTIVGSLMRVTEKFYEDRRERTTFFDGAGGVGSTVTYPNPTGICMVIHIGNTESADEVFGRAEGEAMLTLMHRYGEIFDAALEGNVRQGRATPVIEGLGSQAEVDAFWDKHAQSRTQTLPDGTVETEQYLTFDSNKAIVLGGDAKFRWEGTPAFTTETQNLLGLLFYLYIQHSEIPEWALGNAIASSQASANTQVEPFVKFVEGKRTLAESNWFKPLMKAVQAMAALSEAGVLVDDEVKLKWEDMTRQDGALTISALQAAKEAGVIDNETFLSLLPLDIDDPKAVLKQAQKEADQKAEQDNANAVANAVAAAQAAADAQARNQDNAQPDQAAGQGSDNANVGGSQDVRGTPTKTKVPKAA